MFLQRTIAILGLLGLTGIVLVVVRSESVAQNKLVPGVEVAPDVVGKPVAGPNLPIKHVVLFNSGVGYFLRQGEIDGNQQVDLQFAAGNINDLIKSLVVDDEKGRSRPLRYDSQEPIEKTLKSFGLDLSTNPSMGQLLNQSRGERVEISLNAVAAGLPATITGSIIGMEVAQRPVVGPTTATNAETEILNLYCAEGVRSIPLASIQRLRFLNPVIENELKRALDVVATGHDSLKKSVRLDFRGEGKRNVKVGYVVENPIWKTSYRLNLTGEKAGKLKALAAIENTSDEDWKNIKLTLVSSRPISFQMDLYPPIFVPRPTVEPELFASLRPPMYSGPLTTGQLGALGFGGGQGGFGGQLGFGGGQGGFQGSGQNGIANGLAVPNGSPMQQLQQQQNFLNSTNSANLGNRYANPMGQMLAQGNDKLNYNDFQNKRREQLQNKDAKPNGEAQVGQAAQIGSVIAGVDPNLVEAALAVEQLGNSAQFDIDEMVDLPRQQSAMLPLMDTPIDIKRVSIYNEKVQAKHPLFGLKMKNASKQALMQGPITIYDKGQYVGESQILDLQPGEERFISYAVDTGIEVKPFDTTSPAPELTATMNQGRLSVQYRMRQTRTYVIRNRSLESRDVILEQNVRDSWKLVVPEKPTERTRDQYRFLVTVKPGESLKYEVSEELPRIDPFEITKQADFSGFATSLGLDVWTESKRTPEESFGVRFSKDQLEVNHLDRRTTTYFVRNRANVERTINLEHVCIKDRKLVGDVKPSVEDSHRYSFPLKIKAGETAKHVIVEEFIQARPEFFALRTIEGTPPPRAGTDDPPLARYVTELGLEAWTQRDAPTNILTKGKFEKGELVVNSQVVEKVTYLIKNVSPEPRKITISHEVRTGWSLVEGQAGLEVTGPRVRINLNMKSGDLVKQTFSEQQPVNSRYTLAKLSEAQITEFSTAAVFSEPVKASIKKGVSMLAQITASEKEIAEQVAKQKTIIEEQSRLRINIEKLPNTSMLYKRYLEKMDLSETELEKVQGDLARVNAREKTQKMELETFIKSLSFE
jgi:hypothetical protein